jgi:hypothetical protein
VAARVVDGAGVTWSASVAEDLELVDYDAERLLPATGDYAAARLNARPGKRSGAFPEAPV